MFTFYVGPTKNPFLVYADIISRHSQVLNRIIQGGFKESVEKHADLPEVEPETMRHFVRYAYAMPASTSNNDETKAPTAIILPLSKSVLIELLLKIGHKNFRCNICGLIEELKFSSTFPRCGTCGEHTKSEYTKSRNLCILAPCRGHGALLKSLVCEKCLSALNWPPVNSAPKRTSKLELMVPARLQELKDFRFDIPLRAGEIFKARTSLMAPQRPPTKSLLDAVKLAMFADLYGIEPLFESAVTEVYLKLTQEPLDKASFARLCEIADLVYENTPSAPLSESSAGNTTHVLRKMILDFIAAHRVKFVASPSAHQLFFNGGEFCRDAVLAMFRGEPVEDSAEDNNSKPVSASSLGNNLTTSGNGGNVGGTILFASSNGAPASPDAMFRYTP